MPDVTSRTFPQACPDFHAAHNTNIPFAHIFHDASWFAANIRGLRSCISSQLRYTFATESNVSDIGPNLHYGICASRFLIFRGRVIWKHDAFTRGDLHVYFIQWYCTMYPWTMLELSESLDTLLWKLVDLLHEISGNDAHQRIKANVINASDISSSMRPYFLS